MRNLGALVYEFDCLHIFEAGFVQTLGAAESFGQMLDFAKSELFQQKEKYRPTPGGGRILELTSQIVFGCVLTKVLWFKCVENMV